MKEKKITIGILLAAIMLMAVGYAAFSTSLVINGTANIASSWKVVFTDILQVSKTDGVTVKETPTASGTTATFYVDLTSPGDKIEYKITVANQGTLPAIIESIEASETGSDAINFEISNIKIGDKLAAKASTTFNIIISYDESITSQPDITDNKLTIDVKYVQDLGQTITPSTPQISAGTTFIDAVLDGNTSVVECDSSGSDGYMSPDDENYQKTMCREETGENSQFYYFAGTVKENYVTFGKTEGGTCVYNGQQVYSGDTLKLEGIESNCKNRTICSVGDKYYTVSGYDHCVNGLSGTHVDENPSWETGTKDIVWRIVRINDDKSVKLVTENCVDYGVAFNSSDDDNAYIGYMYGTPGSTGDNAYTLTHSNDKPSTIKTALDSWYANTFTSKEGSLIADNGFCNDRSIASTANAWASGDTALGYGNNTTYYGAYNRVNNLKAPNLGCNKGDLFTTTANPNGNQALQYPIGLLTLDEVWYAGLAPRSGNGSYNYLLNGESFVLMTPEKYFVEDGMYSGVAAVYIVQDISGMEPTVTSIPVTSTTLDKDTCLRPVINLKSTTTVSGGDGTEGSPFKVNVG